MQRTAEAQRDTHTSQPCVANFIHRDTTGTHANESVLMPGAFRFLLSFPSGLTCHILALVPSFSH